jgi:hypothetical protein
MYVLARAVRKLKEYPIKPVIFMSSFVVRGSCWIFAVGMKKPGVV